MALEYTQSFAYGTIAILTSGIWDATVSSLSMGFGASGTGRWPTDPNNRWFGLFKNAASVTKYFTSYATRIIGTAVYYKLFGTQILPTFKFYNDTTVHITVQITLAGEIEVLRGVTQIGITSGVNLPTNTWFYLEIKVTIDNTVGVVEVRKDGVTVLNITGADTQNTANATQNRVQLSAHNVATDGIETFFNDLYVCNNQGGINDDFLGPCRIEMLWPTANGTTNQWTPSAGSNYQNVDEIPNPDSDTTYNAETTANEIDLYVISDLLSASSSIKGATIRGWSRTTATPTIIQLGLRSGGSNSFATDLTLTTSYFYYSRTLDQNPITSVPFTHAEINALEIGAQFIS